MTWADRIGKTEPVFNRIEVLDRLCRSPAHLRDLVEETGRSRRTISRAVNELEAVDLVERGDDGVEATTAGRLARDRFDAFLSEFEDILTAETVLDPLPSGADVAPEVAAGGEPILATDPATYRPLERVHEALTDADRYRALVPTLDDPRTIRLCYEHVVTKGRPAELVVTPEVFETLRREFPRRMAAMADEDGFSVFVGDVPPFGLGLVENDSISSGLTTTVHLLVLTESGSVHGSIVNDADPAIEWAEAQYDRHRDQATDRTVTLSTESDGGVATADAGSGHGTTEVPASLEREGFVGIDVAYFGDQPVEDPATAWRAGLSLAEVHTGYAIQRPSAEGRADSGGDENHPGKPDLATTLANDLGAGSDYIVLGPPGSGKSTICKQVACGWYDAGRGPVLYRQSDLGRPFSSVDDLVMTASAHDGHALVVVEDAVRPTANAVFEAVDRLADRNDVSFLLDARDHEWHDRDDVPADVTELETVSVPPLTEADCERLVGHFERTTDREVEVSSTQLWSAVRDEAATGAASRTNEMLRLVHRLATYADPLSDGPTALEDAVASVYEDLADDDLALSVCVLANALNVAGVGVDRGLLYAPADPDEFGAVDDAIDRLEGRVLFSRTDGRYRTVHEAWSGAFLTHLVRAEGDEGAARRFGAAVSAALALADDADRCAKVAEHVGDPDALDAVYQSPSRWADELVRALHRSAREHARIAPLFGDGDRDSIELPSVCSDRAHTRRPYWLGELFRAAGFYDAAERAYERLPREELELGVERRLGLARIAIERGNHEDAETYCRTALEHVESVGTKRTERAVFASRARLLLGEALSEQGATGEAETAYRDALDRFEELERTRWIAITHQKLGELAFVRDEYEEATERFEASLELMCELGDRRGESSVLNDMAWVPFRQGEYESARELYERTLEIRTALGDRHGQAKSLYNLGLVARHQGDTGHATGLFERSLERYEAVGDRQGQAKVYQSLASLADVESEYDRAHRYNERSLELMRELEDRRGESISLGNLGVTHRHRGELATAESLNRESLELARELDYRDQEARALHNLGNVAADRGEFDRAATLYGESLEILEELGNRRAAGTTLLELGLVELRRGAHDRAGGVIEDGVEIATELDAGRLLAKGERLLAECALVEGDADRAESLVESLDERGVDDDGIVACRVRSTRAKLARERGELDAALEQTELAVEGLAALRRPIWDARGRLVYGRVAAAAGEPGVAREALSGALDTFEEIGAFHDALATLVTLIETFPGDDEAVERWLERARELSAEAPEEVAERHRTWLDRAS